jgi:hypothetical protein
MIKPEMVSDELIEAAEAGCGMGCGAWDCVDEKEVAAAILNAAIEAGLVSPPVWVVSGFTTGEIVSLHNCKAEADEEAKRMHDDTEHAYIVEHWKGQTE